jgi:hypothetical protein
MKIKNILSGLALMGALGLLAGCAVEDNRGPDVVTTPAPGPTVIEDRNPDVTVVNPPAGGGTTTTTGQ